MSEWITSSEAERRYNVKMYRFSRLAKLGKIKQRPSPTKAGKYEYSAESIEHWLETKGARKVFSYASDDGYITASEGLEHYGIAVERFYDAAKKHKWQRKLIDGTQSRYQYDLDDFQDWFFTTKTWKLAEKDSIDVRRPDQRGGGYPGKDDAFFATPKRDDLICLSCGEVYTGRSHTKHGLCSHCKGTKDYRDGNHEGDMVYMEPADWERPR